MDSRDIVALLIILLVLAGLSFITGIYTFLLVFPIVVWSLHIVFRGDNNNRRR